jgi:hypothetical protein
MVVVYAETWINERYDGFLKTQEDTAVDRVRLKKESLAREAVLMNGCIRGSA